MRMNLGQRLVASLKVSAVVSTMVGLILLNGGCVGPERVARLEGKVSGLETIAGENRRIAQGAMAAAGQAQTTANQAREAAEQMGRTATDAQTLAGKLNARIDGSEKIQQEHATAFLEYREFRDKTVVPLMKRVDGHEKKLHAIQGEHAPATPDTSAMVAGPGAPAPKALTKQEGPITLSNPTVTQLKRAIEDDEREQKEVRLYGPTDAARQALYDAFRPIAKVGGLASSTTVRSLNTIKVGIEVDFGPLPDHVKAGRKAPTP